MFSFSELKKFCYKLLLKKKSFEPLKENILPKDLLPKENRYFNELIILSRTYHSF